jgi:phage FluMu protein Com
MHRHEPLHYLRCLCQKLLAVVDGQVIEILCKRCKRLVRIKVEEIGDLENATLTK